MSPRLDLTGLRRLYTICCFFTKSFFSFFSLNVCYKCECFKNLISTSSTWISTIWAIKRTFSRRPSLNWITKNSSFIDYYICLYRYWLITCVEFFRALSWHKRRLFIHVCDGRHWFIFLWTLVSGIFLLFNKFLELVRCQYATARINISAFRLWARWRIGNLLEELFFKRCSVRSTRACRRHESLIDVFWRCNDYLWGKRRRLCSLNWWRI